MRSNFAALDHPAPGDRTAFLHSRLLWCLLAALIISVRAIWSNPDSLMYGTGGPDDAMRVIQIREFLASGSWFEKTIHQVGVPQALHSHWSRLLDVPIAILVLVFNIFLSMENAELAARAIWPVVLLACLIYAVAIHAERKGERTATIAVAILSVCSMVTASQFAPGRIDHHNVQILCTVAGSLFLIRSINDKRFGWYAGATFGLGLSIGLEALLLVAAIVAFACLCAAFVSSLRDTVWRIMIACTAVMTGCFALTIPPSAWFVMTCDAAALNLILLVASVAGAMTLMCRFKPDASPLLWLAGTGVGGLTGVAAYIGSEPACIVGPFGLVNPEIVPIWLSKVSESQSLLYLMTVLPLAATSFIIFVSAAVVISAYNCRRECNIETLTTSFIVVAAAIYGSLYIKLMGYAVWLAIPPIAIWISQLPAIGSVSQRTVQGAAALLLSQNMIAAVLSVPFGSVSTLYKTDKWLPPTRACQPSNLYRDLAKQPRGIAASEINMGPFVAINTPHRVVAGPYHRMDQSILAAHWLLYSSPEQAEALIRKHNVNYVVVCQRGAEAITKNVQPGTMMHLLQNGGNIPYLAPLPQADPQSKLRVWRVQQR